MTADFVLIQGKNSRADQTRLTAATDALTSDFGLRQADLSCANLDVLPRGKSVESSFRAR